MKKNLIFAYLSDQAFPRNKFCTNTVVSIDEEWDASKHANENDHVRYEYKSI